MAVQVDWDDHDHTILLYTVDRAWTWDEMFEAVNKGIGMMDTVSHKVDSIVDLQNSHGLPPAAIARFHHISQLPTEQVGLIILAGGGTLMLSLFNLFKLITGDAAFKYCWVSDLDKAYATAAARRALVVS